MIDNYVARTLQLIDSKALQVEWTDCMLLSLFDLENRDCIDKQRFLDCRAIYKKSHIAKYTTSSEIFITKMYYSENPKEYIDRIDAIYKSFEKKFFEAEWGDDFAALLYECSGKDVAEANEYFRKANDVLKQMQKKQSIFGGANWGLHDAMIIALSGRDVDYYINDMVECVDKFKTYYKKVRDIAYALATPLALSYKMNWKVDDFMKIYNKYINNGIEVKEGQTQYTEKKHPELLDAKYSTSFMNPDSTLNVYTIFAYYIVENVDFEASMPKIIEYYGKLRDVEGIGPTGKFLNWGQYVTKEDALVYATLLVLLEESKNKESIILNLLGDIKLREYIAAMTAVMISTT